LVTPEVGEQERDRLGGHRGAAIRVDGQLVAGDALFGDGVSEQPLGEVRAFGPSEHPAGHVAAV
jgi:hypothetical protein